MQIKKYIIISLSLVLLLVGCAFIVYPTQYKIELSPPNEYINDVKILGHQPTHLLPNTTYVDSFIQSQNKIPVTNIKSTQKFASGSISQDTLTSIIIDEFTLKPSMGFYCGEYERGKITSITFTSEKPKCYDESWSANITDSDAVMGYRLGTNIYIVGEQIYFNENCRRMFCVSDDNSFYWKSLEEVNGLDIVNTSLVTNMSYMFCGGEKLKTLSVDNWDTSNVEQMKKMFERCVLLETLNVANWDVSNVVDFRGMFQGHSHIGDMRLKYLDVSKWNTSSAEKMNHLFYGCSSLKEIDVSNWDVSKVGDFSHMFADCFAMEFIDITKWNTESATSFDALFNDCKSLTCIDISNLNTSKVTQFSQMFENCTNLEKIIGIEEMDVSNAKCYSFSETFHNCKSLTTLDLSHWNTFYADNMARMFAGCANLTYVNVSGWEIDNVKTMMEMFKGCPKELEISGLESWYLEEIDTTNMF